MLKSLVVISHVIHYRTQQEVFAYGPYVREIDIWADLFERVSVVAPCLNIDPPGAAICYSRKNIELIPLPPTGGKTLVAKLRQIALLPFLIRPLITSMKQADVVHVRCPGNLGLLGVLFAPLFSKYRIAKYAGQWNGFSGEPLSARLQRSLLRSMWWGAPVTVYGEWPNQPSHVIPFFTSIMTAEQVARALVSAREKSFTSPLRVLFVGRLEDVKRVSSLVMAIAISRRQGLNIEVAIVGNGSQRSGLQELVEQQGLSDTVSFTGALSFDDVMPWYEWAHCLVLPSVHSEGWPKVIAEAMCHGLICVAVDHGQVGKMVQERGIVIKTGSPEEIAKALTDISANPEKYMELGQSAAQWAAQYSLEGLREALRQLMAQQWCLNGEATSYE